MSKLPIRILLLGLFLSLAECERPRAGDVPSARIEVVDVLDRKVALKRPARRVLLGEGRFLAALAILEREDPVSRIAGMMGEFEQLDPAGYRQYAAAWPQLAQVPRFGRSAEDTVSVERLISLEPDAAVFGLDGHGPSARSKETLDRLAAAGIPVVFIDFRNEPLRNTTNSMTLLGRLLGREKEAAEFVQFYCAELERVAAVLKAAHRRPKVFLESHVGLSEECCRTMADGMMGRLVDFAGGENLARDIVPGASGIVHLEELLARQPEVYVGTAIGSGPTARSQPGRILLGAGVPEDEARASLRAALARPGIRDLNAVKSGHAHAIWHHYYNSPLNVVAVQVFAKWFHPEIFSDLDPAETLDTLHRRFLPNSLSGVYWISAE